eukprot:1668569-Prymnesium_polylepis.1
MSISMRATRPRSRAAQHARLTAQTWGRTAHPRACRGGWCAARRPRTCRTRRGPRHSSWVGRSSTRSTSR